MKHIGLAIFALLLGSFAAPAQDSLNMHRIGGLPVLDRATSVAIFGHYAYVGTENSGFDIVDISNPARPIIAGHSTAVASVRKIAARGDLALVATGTELMIFDATTPTAPVLLSAVHCGAFCVCAQGNYAYVLWRVEWECYFSPVDISDPTVPLFLADFGVCGEDVAVRDNLAYVAVYEDGLHIIDVSDPRAPVRLGNNDRMYMTGIAVQGNYAYIANEDLGFEIMDISVPTDPEMVGYLFTPWSTDVQVQGNYAFLGYWGGGLSAIDVSNPTDPVVVGDMPTLWDPVLDLTLADNRAYVAWGDDGFRILDISHPNAMTEEGRLDSPDQIADLALDGNTVCIADRDFVRLVDVSVPAAPVEFGTLACPSGFCVAAQGSFAYCCSPQGFQIMDFTDPASPRLSGTLPQITNSQDVAVAGYYAYTLDEHVTLRVIDIYVPHEPVIVAEIGTDHGVAVAVQDNLAYVITLAPDSVSDSLKIIAITDPHNLVQLGSAKLPEQAGSVVVGGGYAFAACEQQIAVLNVSDPAEPVVVGSIPQVDHGKLTLSGSLLYVSAVGRLRVYDVTMPTSPYLVGYYDNRKAQVYSASVVNAGGDIFVGGGSVFDVLRLTPQNLSSQSDLQPAEFALHPAYPNPFNPATTLSFSLPVNAVVTLEIYDVLGQLVNTPFAGIANAGDHRITFDGSRLAGGIYFARLQTPHEMMTQKLVLLK